MNVQRDLKYQHKERTNGSNHHEEPFRGPEYGSGDQQNTENVLNSKVCSVCRNSLLRFGFSLCRFSGKGLEYRSPWMSAVV